ncbi:trypsin-like peptidase domain-containing protein [Pseudomonas sp. S37]|uniref:trypsin-like peptidase domain-containing protein n=1 Tax=Pseudomonas sp. S37 TaxID=2767449 RepID=UPI0019118082|nr:trypsin-like peptidase domain-containing protein [Pseudomonas sp. S37]MBK4997285.1 trypsin-like peptidase domain-containing protein [Pseudomonas sp. S37]
MKSPHKNILSTTTILIESTSSGGTSRGTGFMFSFSIAADEAMPMLVTNKHVLENTTKIKLKISISDPSDHSRKIGTTEYTIKSGVENLIFNHPDANIDLAAINIAAILNDMVNSGIYGHGNMFSENDLVTGEELDDLGIAEEILMVGYPTGLSDEVNNLPIVRQGVLASDPKVKFNGREQFMIDCACYHGSSGSPIILKAKQTVDVKNGAITVVNRRNALLGVLFAGPTTTAHGKITIKNIPTTTGEAAQFDHLINLGYVIPSRMILELKNEVLARAPGAEVDISKVVTKF